MKKHIHILLYIILTLTACKKGFFDVKDNSVILAEQYVSDLTTTQHYLNGVYLVLGKEFYRGYIQAYPELIADNIKPANGDSPLLTSYNWNQQPTGAENISEMWKWGYQLASSCSFVIEKASEFSAENPVKAKQLQAEAYSIRALVHFVMVNVFAQAYNYTPDGSHPGIPYKETFDWTKSIKRSSVAEVYTAMINDLNRAIGLFNSDNTINRLVMNKMAAKSLLARIFLFKEDWQQAKSLAIEVVNAVPLMSGSSYPSKLFTLQETEALFQLSPSSTAIIAGSYDTNFQGGYFNIGEYTLYLATVDIATLLKNNPQDIRGTWVKTSGTGEDTVVKYPVDVISGFPLAADSYYPTILRSSEMYLTIAEATARIGEEKTSIIYLDAIRQRADPTATNSTATGTALLDSIYVERRKELAFEGLRMFDLQRWKKDVKRSDPVTPEVAILPYPSEKAIAPIPAIDAQKGIPQNPGYN